MHHTQPPEPGSPAAVYRHMLWVTLGFMALGVVWIGSSYLLAYLIRQHAPFLIGRPWLGTVVNALPLYGIALPVTLLFCAQAPALPTPKHRLDFSEFTLLFPPMFTFMIVGSLMGRIVTSLMNLLPFFETGTAVEDMMTGTDLVWVCVSTLLIAPLMEELVFRKLLIPRLLAVGELPAIVISGLFFGVFHMNFEQFFYAFFLGVIFGWVFVKTGKVIYTVLLHLIVNFFAGILPSLLVLLTAVPGLSQFNQIMGGLLTLSYVLAQYAAAGLGILVLCLFGREIVRSVRRSAYPLGTQVRLLYCNPGTIAMVGFCGLMFIVNMLSL